MDETVTIFAVLDHFDMRSDLFQGGDIGIGCPAIFPGNYRQCRTRGRSPECIQRFDIVRSRPRLRNSDHAVYGNRPIEASCTCGLKSGHAANTESHYRDLFRPGFVQAIGRGKKIAQDLIVVIRRVKAIVYRQLLASGIRFRNANGPLVVCREPFSHVGK